MFSICASSILWRPCTLCPPPALASVSMHWYLLCSSLLPALPSRVLRLGLARSQTRVAKVGTRCPYVMLFLRKGLQLLLAALLKFSSLGLANSGVRSHKQMFCNL